MKAIRLALSAIMVVMLTLAGCAGDPAEPGMDLPEPTGDFTMNTQQSSYPVDTETIDIVITNNTSEETSYGMGYDIERYNNDAWERVPLEFAVTLQAAILYPHESNTQEILLYQDQYDYTPGKYRVIKTIGSEDIAVEFLLE